LKGYFAESIVQGTGSLRQVAGGSPNLGEAWKQGMSGNETMQVLLKRADNGVLKCYAQDITKRIAALEAEIAAASSLCESFSVKYETPQSTVDEICKGAASLLEGRIIQNYRAGDLAKRKAYEKHLQTYKTCLGQFGMEDDDKLKVHIHATLWSHLQAVVKGST
jgi:hypothetical protein